MKKQLLLLSLVFFVCSLNTNAQEKVLEKAKKDLIETSKFGGFVIGRAAFNDRDLSTSNKNHSNFDLRLVRAYVDGKVLNFAYKLQVEYEGYGGVSEKGKGGKNIKKTTFLGAFLVGVGRGGDGGRKRAPGRGGGEEAIAPPAEGDKEK